MACQFTISHRNIIELLHMVKFGEANSKKVGEAKPPLLSLPL